MDTSKIALPFLVKIEEEISSFKNADMNKESAAMLLRNIITLATLAKDMVDSSKPEKKAPITEIPSLPKPKFVAPCKNKEKCKFGAKCTFYHTKEEREVFKTHNKKLVTESTSVLCIPDTK